MTHNQPTAPRRVPLQIFLHVPKTAGTTLDRILKRQYGERAVYQNPMANPHPQEAEMFYNRPAREAAATRVFSGHFYFGIHEYLPRPALQYTLLRDPIEREISNYYHVLRAPTSPQHQEYISEVAPQMTMERYLASGYNVYLDNLQTRLLAGLSGQAKAIIHDPCSEEMLERAIDNLQNSFVFAGIAEEFDASALMLQDLLGWRTPYYQRANIGTNRPPTEDISPQALEAIHANTRYDRRLYEYVAREFHARLAAQSPQFHARLAAFPAANRRYWHRYQLVQNAIQATRRRFGAARRLLVRPQLF